MREEGLWVYKDSAWVKVGANQSGAINYLTNGDAEAGNTTGWSLGNVTLTSNFPSGVPTFGSGASGNLSFTNSSSSPIAGTRSFVLSSSAATTAGNFLASDAFTIDSADLAKVLSIDITYSVTSGTINASGTSSNSLGIAIYDVTASQWIMPAGVWAITQTLGVGRAVATFQTPITSTQYRLVLFNANATSGAVTLKLDRLSVGPVSIPVGAPVTDWVDAGTVTITATTTNPTKGTTATDKVRWRRVGDSAEIRYEFRQTTAGTAGSGVYLLSLPSGLVIDTNKISVSNDTTANYAASVAATASLGEGLITDSSSRGALIARAYSSTQLVLQTQVYYSAANLWGTTGNYALNAAALGVSVTVRVPIAGWSSQVQMSNDTDTRVVAASATRTTTQALTANVTDIVMTTATFDSHAAYNTTTGAYVAPITGYYAISGTLNLTTSPSSAFISAYVNGTLRTIVSAVYNGASFILSQTVLLSAGDSLTLRCDSSVSINSSRNALNISRLSGPAVVAASESVNASYWVSANFAASTTVPINFDSKEFDSHNAVTPSATVFKFTAPVTGTFQVSGYFQNTGTAISLVIYKNGVAYKSISACTSTAAYGTFSNSVRLNAGDYIDLRPSAAATFIGGTLAGTTTSNISITRVGN